ncbi:MAG TPA: phospholipase D-like domain-containing protein [Chitinophagaceae bacterium]|nr:phospholipase D-like domain-containing protein [Chitinophagaceae bacterium]
MAELIPTRREAAYTAQNKVRLVKGGREYFDLLLQLIDEAQESIHLQTYIYDDDETGQQVARALKAAAARNVQVYLMADGYASQVMSQSFIDDLRSGGVNFRFFKPLLKSRYFYIGRRLHHKVTVVDTRYALVGGINITNRYNDIADQPPWLDFALYVEGEAARELCVLCWKSWKEFPATMGLTPCETKTINFDFLPAETCHVRVSRNDWVRNKNQISHSYIEMLQQARRQITILCSYFFPGRIIMRHLLQAARRGVKIRLIMAGQSDILVTKYAERYIYDRLLRYHISVYEYRGAVLHGKLAVCDEERMTIGSYNVNNISAYASIELNLDVKSRDFVSRAQELLDKIIIENCEQVTADLLAKKRNIFQQFVNWLSYTIIKAILFLFTFYFRQAKN